VWTENLFQVKILSGDGNNSLVFHNFFSFLFPFLSVSVVKELNMVQVEGWAKEIQAVVEIRINICKQKLIKTLRLKEGNVIIVGG